MNTLDDLDDEDELLSALQEEQLERMASFNKTRKAPTQARRMQFLQVDFPSRLHLEAAVCALRIIEQCGWYTRILKGRRIRDEDVLSLVGLEEHPDNRERTSTHELRAALRAQAARLGKKLPSKPDVLGRNLEKLGALLKLGKAELRILRLAALSTLANGFEDLFVLTLLAESDFLHAAQVATGLPRGKVVAALASNRALRRSGFFANSDGFRRRTNPIELSEITLSTLLAPRFDEDLFLRSLVRIAPRSTLAMSDFAHIADLSLVQRYLADAARHRKKGVNVLIHGAPGTGKTEFVRTLSQELGLSLFEVPNEDDDGDPISGRKRFSSYAVCQSLLAGRRRHVLLFDEVEDVFGLGSEASSLFAFFRQKDSETLNKGWINQTLEENPIPTFWVSNSIGQIDAAYLRRFDLILEFAEPPRAVRRRFIDGHFRAGEISLACAEKLASLRNLSPGHVARIARVARSLRTRNPAQRDAEIERIALTSLKAAGLEEAMPSATLPSHYDPTLLNADCDLTALAKGLQSSPAARLCLYGRPGTGKTAFAQHLGRVLDRPVLAKRGSDLLGMFVGQTEARIAEVFREARDEDAILVIDEADGFLRDRSGAQRNWEVTQVNELLTQMEAFDGIFIASTNLIDTLDAASLRRFDFKVKFDYLNVEQRRALVAKACAVPVDSVKGEARAQLDRLDAITPGDVAVALRQCRVTGRTPTVESLVHLLAAEQAMKPECKRKPMGFVQ